WPLRNSIAPAPVSASLPRSQRSTTPHESCSARSSAASRSVSVAATLSSIAALRLRAMGLADTFQQTVDALPEDWTDLELDLRIADESRYVDAATFHGTLKLLDEAGIGGELAVRETRRGRAEIREGWGRPQSAREEFRRLR